MIFKLPDTFVIKHPCEDDEEQMALRDKYIVWLNRRCYWHRAWDSESCYYWINKDEYYRWGYGSVCLDEDELYLYNCKIITLEEWNNLVDANIDKTNPIYLFYLQLKKHEHN